jgi:hypothetical protein
MPKGAGGAASAIQELAGHPLRLKARFACWIGARRRLTMETSWRRHTQLLKKERKDWRKLVAAGVQPPVLAVVQCRGVPSGRIVASPYVPGGRPEAIARRLKTATELPSGQRLESPRPRQVLLQRSPARLDQWHQLLEAGIGSEVG